MNRHHALGFAGLGLSLKLLPFLVPSVSVASNPDSTRALWLAFMSLVLMAVGGIWFGRQAYFEVRARWTQAQAVLAARRIEQATGRVASNAGRARLSA